MSITGNKSVIVGGKSYQSPVTLSEPLSSGQDLTVQSGTRVYYIRCLPSDFPTYSATVSGQPQSKGYMVTNSPYVMAFDSRGVPVWWFKDPFGGFSPIDAKFLSSTTISWWDQLNNGEFVEVGLDGSFQGLIGGGPNAMNFHDLRRLSNGNYLGILDYTTNCPAVPSQCVDLSSWGLSAQSSIEDNVLVEVTPSNQIVWSWDPIQHLNLAQENVNWRDAYPDVIHMNAALPDGNGGVIFSNRHLDAVYRIDMKTGAITWKLGGTSTPQSLKVIGDHYPAVFSGQHFPFIEPDGTISVHDNGTRAGRAPRALRFSIDTSAKTATIVEQMSDSRVTSSNCCGSAAKLGTGDWVISWGGNPIVTELSPSGVPQLTLNLSTFSYRVQPLKASVTALRNGMDVMVPPLKN